MRCLLILSAILGTLLLVWPTYACGGGFGQEVTIDPTQTIFISHRTGQERYVFQPQFCGAARDFGLILPVPAALAENPTLVDAALYTELADITAPRVETVDVCKQAGLFGSDSSKGGLAYAENGADSTNGVDVIDQGTVGIFSWTLLKADTASTFTDWLDANQFPYPPTALTAFDHYVSAGFYFVAFQVTASTLSPTSGSQICGKFGPIRLTFPATQAVIPARMATASDRVSTFYWRLFAVAEHQYATTAAAQAQPTLRFAGQLTDSDLTAHPEIATVAATGDWLTELDLSFYAGSLTDDITLTAAAEDKSYQRVIYVENEVNCGVFGCNVAAAPNGTRWFGALLALAGGVFALAAAKRQPRTRN
jgi:hypothetical protein